MSIKSELAHTDRQAAEAKAAAASLAEQLRQKTHRYSPDGKLRRWSDGPKFAEAQPAEFSPQTAGLAVQIDGIRLSGGPYDGYEVKVPRGAASYERPAGGTDGFYPARYRRTAKRADDGLAVFQYQELVSAASA